MVYVISKDGKPLMPTKRFGKVRRWLKNGQAEVVNRNPFTIRLKFETTVYTQKVTLGIDSGYENIGYSATTEKDELIGGEVKLAKGISKRIEERSKYRGQRRGRLRHRVKRFENRKRKSGWLAPSILHKLESHVSFVEKIKSFLPISEVVVEVANFDIQKIKNPDIEGEMYQQGSKLGFWNLREYILHRDEHRCQNPDCKNNDTNIVLQVHHIGYWRDDRTDREENLICLCTKCHTPANHKESAFLHGWQPELNSFRPETFMSIVRWRLKNMLSCEHTYGHITKNNRISFGLKKTHHNDAFCISGGKTQKRVETFVYEQIRRNNRSLEKFYDKKVIDTRTGEKVSGQELFSGRRKRNKNLNDENLRVYRGETISNGRRSIRKQRYFYQSKDIVEFNGNRYIVKGVQNYGTYIKLEGLPKPIKTDLVSPLEFKKGFALIG